MNRSAAKRLALYSALADVLRSLASLSESMADESIEIYDRMLDADDVTARLSNVAHERFFLSEMKQELLRDLNKIQKDMGTMQADMAKLLDLQRQLSGKVAVVGATMVGFGSPGGVDLICGSCKSKKNVIELPVPGLKEAISGANMAVPLVQLLCILTTNSFALQVEHGRAIAKPEAMDMFMEKDEDVLVLRNASGFSMLAFAVKNNLKKLKFATGVGRLCSLFTRESMIEALDFVRGHMYGQGRRAEAEIVPEEAGNIPEGQTLSGNAVPTWHKSLTSATIDAIRQSVESVCRTLEFQDPPRRRSRSASRGGNRTPTGSSLTPTRSPPAQLPLSRHTPAALALSPRLPAPSPGSSHSSLIEGPPAKRMRTSGGVEGMMDTSERWRRQAVKTMRGEWIEFLNEGRVEMRSVMHKEFMFLREVIEHNFERQTSGAQNGIALAGHHGYRFFFNNRNLEKEMKIPENVRGTIWDKMATGSYENVQKVFELRDEFSCLTVQVHYKREVRRNPGEAVKSGGPDGGTRPIYHEHS